jgi:hypothetical protein
VERKKIEDLERQRKIDKLAATKDREAHRQHNLEQRANAHGGNKTQP